MTDPTTRQAIYQEWVERVFGAAFKRRGLFSQAEDPFSHTVRSDLTRLLEILFSDAPVDGALAIPEDLIRLRAVQEISAAEAVSHLFVLKDIVRERLGRDPAYENLSRRLDFLALHTFNAYAMCRESLYRQRVREIAEYGGSETFACQSPPAPGPGLRSASSSGNAVVSQGEP